MGKNLADVIMGCPTHKIKNVVILPWDILEKYNDLGVKVRKHGKTDTTATFVSFLGIMLYAIIEIEETVEPTGAKK